MTLWLYLLSFSHSTALDRRLFVPGNDFFHGEWELSDFASFDDRGLILPAGSSAWRITRLPSDRFSLSLSIRTPALAGVWITRDFGDRLHFPGFAILLNLSLHSIQAEYRESGSAAPFPEYHSPQAFDNSPTVLLTIDFSSSNQTIFVTYDNTSHALFSGPNRIPGIKPWLSLTADSPSPVIFESFRLTPHRTIAPPPRISRPPLSAVRSATDLVRMIDSLTVFVDDLPSSESLTNAVLEQFAPITESWQRRSLRMLRSIRGLATDLTNQLNATTSQFAGFRAEVETEIYAAVTEIGAEIEPLYFGAVANEFEYNARLRDQHYTAFRFEQKDLLLLLCVVEGMCVFFYFVSRLCDYAEPPIREPAAFKKS
jgi:hypothetical protein